MVVRTDIKDLHDIRGRAWRLRKGKNQGRNRFRRDTCPGDLPICRTGFDKDWEGHRFLRMEFHASATRRRHAAGVGGGLCRLPI
jgi:hypothetical protein